MALELNFLVGKLESLPTSATGTSEVEFVLRIMVDPGFVDRMAALISVSVLITFVVVFVDVAFVTLGFVVVVIVVVIVVVALVAVVVVCGLQRGS